MGKIAKSSNNQYTIIEEIGTGKIIIAMSGSQAMDVDLKAIMLKN